MYESVYIRNSAVVAPPIFNPRTNLGLRIRALRANLVITQEDLAERCGLFRTYLSRIETGRANPTLTMLYDLADALGVSVTDLLTPLESGTDREAAKVTKVNRQQKISRGRVR